DGPPRAWGPSVADLDGEALRLQTAWSGIAGSVDVIRSRFGDRSIGTGGNGLRAGAVDPEAWA
ncbi:MAG: hypothetical protein M0Z93_05010, partial [Actinomycetota bacterium]|nr:hypothetical protein [Actinomycetota bacterium]